MVHHHAAYCTTCAVSFYTSAGPGCVGWTELPGTELRRDEGDSAGARTIAIRGSRLEFVMTNAEGGW